jgi:hypothetical protein
MKPLRVEYDPNADALAIDFPGFGGERHGPYGPHRNARLTELERRHRVAAA